MTLPPNFGHWEHLQDMLRRDHNKIIAHYFRDLGESWEPEITTNRGALRMACTLDDKDTAIQTLIRLYFFHEVLGYGKKGLGIFYGTPSEQFQEAVEGRPQVFFYFSQDEASVPEGQRRVEAEYSFRLMDETSASITPVKALALARSIKEHFLVGNSGMVFTKGKTIYKYYDELKGYRLRLYGNSESDAVDLIKKMVAVREHVYDEKKLVICTPKKASLSNPTAKKKVYGKSLTEQRYRPTANVRFRYSYLYIHGITKPIFLVDTTGRHFDAVA